MLTRSLWSWTLNFCALKALLSGCWPGRMGRLCTRNLSRQCCRSGAKLDCATSTSLTCAVSPGATAVAQKDTNQWEGQGSAHSLRKPATDGTKASLTLQPPAGLEACGSGIDTRGTSLGPAPKLAATRVCMYLQRLTCVVRLQQAAC